MMNKRRSIIGLCAFLLGGAAAATLSLGNAPKAQPLSKPQAIAAIAPGRVAVDPASARKALTVGAILHPVSSILSVPGKMHYGDYRWDDEGVPAGTVWVRVDLNSQIISVFRGDHEIGTAVILYGADGLQTPTGRFPVLAKLKDHRSQTYDAPMPYTLRLTSDGISIHASDVRWGYATHGCVGVPMPFAEKLFDSMKVGGEVLIVGEGKARPATA